MSAQIPGRKRGGEETLAPKWRSLRCEVDARGTPTPHGSLSTIKSSIRPLARPWFTLNVVGGFVDHQGPGVMGPVGLAGCSPRGAGATEGEVSQEDTTERRRKGKGIQTCDLLHLRLESHPQTCPAPPHLPTPPPQPRTFPIPSGPAGGGECSALK